MLSAYREYERALGPGPATVVSYDDRAALVSVIDETYAVIGCLLASRIPLAAGAVRPEVVDSLRGVNVEPAVDITTLASLRDVYDGALDSVLELQEALLDDAGDAYDSFFSEPEVHRDEQTAIPAFREELAALVTALTTGRTEHASNVLDHGAEALRPLDQVPRLSPYSRRLLALVAAVREQLRAD